MFAELQLWIVAQNHHSTPAFSDKPVGHPMRAALAPESGFWPSVEFVVPVVSFEAQAEWTVVFELAEDGFLEPFILLGFLLLPQIVVVHLSCRHCGVVAPGEYRFDGRWRLTLRPF